MAWFIVRETISIQPVHFCSIQMLVTQPANLLGQNGITTKQFLFTSASSFGFEISRSAFNLSQALLHLSRNWNIKIIQQFLSRALLPPTIVIIVGIIVISHSLLPWDLDFPNLDQRTELAHFKMSVFIPMAIFWSICQVVYVFVDVVRFLRYWLP